MTITLEAALVKIFITVIICLFIYLVVDMILRWIRKMAEDGLPMFTHGSLEWKPNSDKEETKTPIGFNPLAEADTPETKPTDAEIKEAILQDPSKMISALMRGEVDIDEILGS
jgi:hypothetical protein